SVPLEGCLHLVAEGSFDFEYPSTDALPGVVSAVGNELLRIGIQTAGGFAGSDRSEDRNAGEESALGNGQPIRMLGGNGLPRVMYFSQHKEELVALLWFG